MIRLVEHIPGYADGCTPRIVKAATVEEFYAHPLLWHHSDGEIIARSGEVRRRPFYRFSLSSDYGQNHLMAEYDEGRHWRVVGTITHGLEQLVLPQWKTHPDGDRATAEWNRGNTNYDDGRWSTYSLVTKD